MGANDNQVGGSHYRSEIQHWDFVWANRLDYFQGQITKYVARHKQKGGINDLKKAQHFLQKYIELLEEEEQAAGVPSRGYVDQDGGFKGVAGDGVSTPRKPINW